MSADPEKGEDPKKAEEGSKDEPSKTKRTCLGCDRNVVRIILACVALLLLATFGGLMLVLCLLLVIIVLYHKAIASAIEHKEYLIVNVIATILDPLFFYILELDDKKKCIHWHQPLWIIATVLRSVLDALKFVEIISELRKEEFNDLWRQFKISNWRQQFQNLIKEKGNILQNETVRKWMLFVVDILAILPIPQVLVIFKTRRTSFSKTMAFFVLQYSLRVIRSYFLFTHAIEVSGVLAGATWAIFGFYVLLYLQSGHMFGAIWYYYAIEKATECWSEACKNRTCSPSRFSCKNAEDRLLNASCNSHSSFFCTNSTEIELLNASCNISTGSNTSYNFGIYKEALESGIVSETDFLKKLLGCLQWGLQHLRFAVFHMAWILITVLGISAFGQGLQTSLDVGENIFAICMTILGVVLFVFLIGNMQSETIRSQKINQKWQGIKQSKHYGDISGDQKVLGKFKKAKREKLVNKHVDVHIDGFLNDLSADAAKEVKRHIGPILLRKVEEFENWSEESLGYLCEFLKPVFFIERTRIIPEGDPIDEMLFVLKGKLRTYSTARNEATATASNNCHRRRENLLKDGDFFGEELIAWARDEPSSNLPISKKTIQALTDVEAFALMADDLEHVLSLRHFDRAALLIQSYWRFRKFLSDRKKAKKKSHLRKALGWAAKELR